MHTETVLIDTICRDCGRFICANYYSLKPHTRYEWCWSCQMKRQAEYVSSITTDGTSPQKRIEMQR